MVKKEGFLKMPTGKDLAESIEKKFLRDGLPVLRKNEEWRRRSRRVKLNTCPPGSCPRFGDWPPPKFNIDESD